MPDEEIKQTVAEPISASEAIQFYDRLDSTNCKKADIFFTLLKSNTQIQENRFRKEVPQGTLKVIKGANHYVFLSHPNETEAMIREFLN